jgi:hypothetical protein
MNIDRTRPARRRRWRMVAVVLAAAMASGMATPAAEAVAPNPDGTADSVMSPQGVDSRGRALQPGGRTVAASPGPSITREQIIARAESWLHPPVPYSMNAYKDGYRTDCSGYVSMAWRTNGNYWTGDLHTIGVPIAFTALRPGDMLLFHNLANPVDGSHVVIFHRWTGAVGGDFYMYEQSPEVTKYRTWSSAQRPDDPSKYRLQDYKPFRYVNVRDSAPRDFDGDGRTDRALYQPVSGSWLIRNIGTDTWGHGGSYLPVVTDFNNDGQVDRGLFEPATGHWWVRNVGMIDTWGDASYIAQ